MSMATASFSVPVTMWPSPSRMRVVLSMVSWRLPTIRIRLCFCTSGAPSGIVSHCSLGGQQILTQFTAAALVPWIESAGYGLLGNAVRFLRPNLSRGSKRTHAARGESHNLRYFIAKMYWVTTAPLLLERGQFSLAFCKLPPPPRLGPRLL